MGRAAVALLLVFGYSACKQSDYVANAAPAPAATGAKYSKPDRATLKKRLTPLQYRVTQDDGTEPPFNNAYWNEKRSGIFVDITTGAPLFSSTDKFRSGTGWPSFTRPIDPASVTTKSDTTHGMVRVEARSAIGDAHLGHVFKDGPPPTGERWCINSASLEFIPLADLAKRGYGDYSKLFGANQSSPPPDDTDNSCAEKPSDTAAKPAAGCSSDLEVAVLAGGCFWGMEEILRKVPGVLDTEVGYAGGATATATYKQVSSGSTRHAEAIRVTFDPKVVSFETLLTDWFFRMHDPTTLNRQGNDRGTQYRSAIFFSTPEQEKTARAVIAKVNASKSWKDPVVTEVTKAGPFTAAEAYHQDYLQRKPNGYTCHYMRD